MKDTILGLVAKVAIMVLAISTTARAQIYFLDVSTSPNLKAFSPKTKAIQTVYKPRDGFSIQQYVVAPGKRRIAIIEFRMEIDSVVHEPVGQPRRLTIISSVGNILFQVDSVMTVSWSIKGDSLAILKAVAAEGEAAGEYDVVKNMGIWIYSFKTTKLVKITDEAANDVVWAPHNNKIYFSLPRGSTHEPVRCLGMGDRKSVSTKLKSIDISPDGKFNLFGGGEGGNYTVFYNRSDSSYSLNKYFDFGLEGAWISWGAQHLIFIDGFSSVYAFDAGKRQIVGTYDGRIIALDTFDKQLLVDLPGFGLKVVDFRNLVENRK